MSYRTLDLYDRLADLAREAVPDDAEYITDVHAEWRKDLEQVDGKTLTPEQSKRILDFTRHVEHQLDTGLSGPALVEWVDAYPSAIMAVTRQPEA